MKHLLISFLILSVSVVLLISPAYSQVEKYEKTFPNGQLMFKGRYRLCVTQDSIYPYVINYEQRKIGKWIDYYPSGIIRETREYTKRVKSCDIPILKEGEWKHFNEDGVQYLSETYKQDTLVYTKLDIYEYETLVGEITITDRSRDTLRYQEAKATANLIPNPSFDQYFYRPVTLINDGQNQIEQLIPYWHSPDKATPDYYNQYRKVDGIPSHFRNYEAEKNGGYIGLMLFLGDPENNFITGSQKSTYGPKIDYTESIQAKLAAPLSQGKPYCFKTKIIRSGVSGYAIDRFGVLFSETPLAYSYSAPPNQSHLSFTEPLQETNNWTTLCKAFTANGQEAFITLGRFSALDQTTIIRHLPNQLSELDINRSAYYLLDDIQLYEISTPTNCGCQLDPAKEMIPYMKNTFDEISLDSRHSTGSKFILGTIQFDFNETEIKTPFLPELRRLLTYMESNPTVEIMIYGHTDDISDEIYNQNLSSGRAKAIREWLIHKGIHENRIQYRGVGEKIPLVENATEADREMNRRVEFEIIHE